MRGHALAGTGGSIEGGRKGARTVGAVAAIVVCLAAFLGIGASAAGAASTTESYGYLASFGSPAGGEVSQYAHHNGVALGGSGEIFAAREGDGSVAIFSPDGTVGGVTLTSVDLSTAAPGGVPITPVDIAVDPNDGALYIRSLSTGVYRFVSDGQPTPTYTLDPGFASFPASTVGGGLAVDPTTGDLLFADIERQFIQRLDSDGTVLATYPIGGSPSSLAVGSSGDIYLVDANNSTVRHLLSDGTVQQPLALPDGAIPFDVAANSQTGEVVVLVRIVGRYYLQGYSAAGAPTFREPLLTGSFTQSAGEPGGLAWDSTSDRIYYATDDGIVHAFVPQLAPGLDVPTASNLTSTSADLSVGIAPAGSTTARLELCAEASAFKNCSDYPVSDDPLNPIDPSNPWRRLAEHPPLSGLPTTIADTATDLLPNTTYFVRAVAFNETGGTETTSQIGTFHTATPPPGVTTGPASAVDSVSAVVSGTIDTFGDQTTYRFEYGTDANYGSRVPSQADATAGNNREARTFSRTISGLQPGTTYHYRLVGTNSQGDTTPGEDRTFTTLDSSESAPERGYEQVSPVDKGGAVIPGLTHNAAAPDGNSMVISTSAPPPDADTTMIFQHFITHRGAQGWKQWKQADAPQTLSRGLFETSTWGVSDDFDHALVVSNRDLAPGGVAGMVNLYVHNLPQDTYTWVAKTPTQEAYQAWLSPQTSATYFAAGASDFSWVVFYSQFSLIEGVPNSFQMYKWSQDDGLTVLSRLPDGSPTTSSVKPMSAQTLTQRNVSADGEVAYFKTDEGIYRRSGGQTTEISLSQKSGGGPSGAVGHLVLDGVSPDGRYAIFRAQAQLTDDASELTGQPVSNIYKYDNQDESLEFLAVGGDLDGRVHVVSADTRTIAFEDPSGGLSVIRDGVVTSVDHGLVYLWVLMSPNGRYIGYRKGTYGGSFGEAYFYDAEAQEKTCVSCPADGGPGGNLAYTHFDARSIGNRAPQVVTDNGMMFFDTPVRLVPADHNGRRDVYAFQHGQLSMISPGNADFDARFSDASDNGRDVFFTTDQGLVGQDTDGATDMYDARVGGGFAGQSPPAPPAPCVGDACRGTVVLPPDPLGIGTQAGSGARGEPKAARLSVARPAVVVGSAGALTVKVSGPGRIHITGSGVLRSSRSVQAAGTYRLGVKLSKAMRQKLPNAHRLTTELEVSFSSLDGQKRSATVRMTFKSKERR